ncbi:MAG: hypothetical protein ACRD16_15780 [Thermoanaerobaculia bacterium]
MSAICLLAVYTGSCAFALVTIGRFLLPVSRRARIALTLLPLVLTGRALLSGSFYGPLNLAYQTPPLSADVGSLGPRELRDGILSDVAVQMVPWRKAVRESLKHGQLPLWNRFMLGGDVLLGAAQPAALSPTTLLSCLLPLATAWTFSCAFTLFLAAAFGFLFLSDLGLSGGPAFFGAAAWMLSEFMVFFIGWPQAAVFSVLPLLVFSLRRLGLRAPGGFGATIAALVLVALGGHPESMLHVVAAGGLFLLFELLRRRGNPAKPILRAAAAGVLAFGLSAPVLLPFLQVVPESVDFSYRRAVWAHQKKSHSVHDALVLAGGAVYPNVRGPVWTSSREPRDFLDASNAFVGGLALAFAVLGMLSRRSEKWSVALVGAVSFSTAIGFPVVTDGISRLPLFDLAINVRLAGVAAFCIAVLAALGVEELLERPGLRNRAVVAAAGGALLCGGVALRWRGAYGAPAGEFAASMGLLAGPAVVLAVLARSPAGRRSSVAAGALALLLASRLAETPPLYPTFSSRLFYPPIPELSLLPKTEEPYRVAGAGANLLPNESALWELEDPRGYEGMTSLRYDATFPLWCVRQPVWFNRIDDLTKPFLAFLNVRFAVGGPNDSVPAGWRELTRGSHCAIFENPAALGRAFIPRQVVFASDLGDAMAGLRELPEFGTRAVIEDVRRAGLVVPNGRGTVSVRRRNSGLDLAVSAKERCWVIVSNSSWSGWRAREKGRSLGLFHANGAFLAFEVEPGEHRIDLRYLPAAFPIGVGLAVTSTLVLVAIGLRDRRREKASSTPAVAQEGSGFRKDRVCRDPFESPPRCGATRRSV